MSEILLIPGNMCDERLWQPVAGRLSTAGYQVRHSPRLDQPSIAAMAQAVLASIEAPVIAVGFSMGAIVATEMARVSPESITALGLVAFNASDDLPERAAARPRQQDEVRAGGLRRIIADELKPNYLADANRHEADILSLVLEMALAQGPAVFVSQSEALRLRDDLRPALSNLAMPVMLACGSEDRLCPPEWHRRWAELIGDKATFREIAGAGHLVPLEQPGDLAEALLEWLAEDRN